MFHHRKAAAAAVLLGFSAGCGSGQTLTEQAARIQSRVEAGDAAGAMAAAAELTGLVWQMTPDLGFSEAVLVAEPATGYGIYNLRPTTRFRLGESIYVYAEPWGYGFGSPGEGLFSIGFFVDLQVIAADGTVLGEVPGVAELDWTSRVRLREFQATITYDLGGIAPGSYVLVTRLRDKNSPKSGSFETSIEIVP